MRSRLKCPGAERCVPPRLSACPVFPLVAQKKERKKEKESCEVVVHTEILEERGMELRL